MHTYTQKGKLRFCLCYCLKNCAKTKYVRRLYKKSYAKTRFTVKSLGDSPVPYTVLTNVFRRVRPWICFTELGVWSYVLVFVHSTEFRSRKWFDSIHKITIFFKLRSILNARIHQIFFYFLCIWNGSRLFPYTEINAQLFELTNRPCGQLLQPCHTLLNMPHHLIWFHFEISLRLIELISIWISECSFHMNAMIRCIYNRWRRMIFDSFLWICLIKAFSCWEALPKLIPIRKIHQNEFILKRWPFMVIQSRNFISITYFRSSLSRTCELFQSLNFSAALAFPIIPFNLEIWICIDVKGSICYIIAIAAIDSDKVESSLILMKHGTISVRRSNRADVKTHRNIYWLISMGIAHIYRRTWAWFAWEWQNGNSIGPSSCKKRHTT